MYELSRLRLGLMRAVNLRLWAAGALLVGGLVHLIPSLDAGLTALTGGRPWLQMALGLLSVVMALIMFSHDNGQPDDI